MKESNNIHEIIIRIFQDSVTEEEMSVFSKWFNESEENEKTYFEMKNIYDKLFKDYEPSEKEIYEGWKHLRNKIEAPEEQSSRVFSEKTKRQKIRIIILRTAVAAAILYGIVLTGVLFFNKKTEPVTYAEIYIQPGSKSSDVILPDGTKVKLNVSSRLKFPNKFTDSLREVFLDGEAYFDVVKNEKLPFIVHTDLQDIEVLGTSFNLTGYSEDPFAVTTLRSGKIKVRTFDAEHNPDKEIILKPDQEIYFDKKTGEIHVSDSKVNLANMWVNDVYHFKDEPVSKIVKRMERLYGVKIILENKIDDENIYTGTLPLSKDIHHVMNVINFKNQFSYEYKQDTIIIRKTK